MPPVDRQEGWLHETLSGASRFLNGLTGGDGSVTFSARCGDMAAAGRPWGPQLVAFVDWLNRLHGHCENARLWHVDHGLLPERPPFL